MRLSNTASRSIIPGKLTLALSCCLEVGEAERQLACSLCSSSRFPALFLCSFPGCQVGANTSLLSGRISSWASVCVCSAVPGIWQQIMKQLHIKPLGRAEEMNFHQIYVRKGSNFSQKMGYVVPLQAQLHLFQLRHFNSNGELSYLICRAAPLDFSFVNGTEISQPPVMTGVCGLRKNSLFMWRQPIRFIKLKITLADDRKKLNKVLSLYFLIFNWIIDN